MIKAAVIGVTGFGSTHYNDLLREYEAGRVQPVAAVIINPDDAQDKIARLQEIGCDILPDFDSLIAKYSGKLDICCIPTGIASHESLTIEALEHNCNVLVEKPLTGSMEAARKMAAAEHKAGKCVMVGYQHIYLPGIQRIKQLLCSGKLGKVKRITAMGLWPRGDQYYARNAWAGKLAVDGTPVCDSPINNAFAHYLNIALFFAGKTFEEMMMPETMQAEIYRCRKEIETFDNCSVKLTSAEGTQILVMFSHTCKENTHPVLHVECENGSADWEDAVGWKVCDAAGNVLDSADSAAVDRGVMFDAAVAKLKDSSTFVCTTAAAAVQTYCIDQLHKHFAINQVPAEFFVRNEADGALQLQDVEAVWRKANAEFLMPSQAGAAWGVASIEIKLDGFRLLD